MLRVRLPVLILSCQMTLEILTSDLLQPFRHGFFTRAGGASSGVFHGLNCGYGSSDQHDIVRINRDRVAHAMDVAPPALTGVHQVHSPRVVHVDEVDPTAPPEADGIVSTRADRAISVLTADCMPILLGDPAASVVGAAHAGWRGALSGVIEATLDSMEAAGARRERIAAVIGPSISQASYEVGPEMFDDITADAPETQRFFAAGAGDRMQFDLPGYGLWRLRRAGVGQAEWVRHCTYADPLRFFSYRRSTHRQEADYGRLIAAIRA